MILDDGRRLASAISLAVGAVLLLGGWAFLQAGTGAVLLLLGLAAIALGVAFGRSRRALFGGVIALLVGLSPIIVILIATFG